MVWMGLLASYQPVLLSFLYSYHNNNRDLQGSRQYQMKKPKNKNYMRGVAMK